MIQIVQVPFSDPDRQTLHDWLNAPGRLLYQRFLSSQASEMMATAANVRVRNEQGDKEDSELLTDQARVIVAANKAFDQVLTKEFKFYCVELRPETPAK